MKKLFKKMAYNKIGRRFLIIFGTPIFAIFLGIKAFFVEFAECFYYSYKDF